jgi:hypothetical protein
MHDDGMRTLVGGETPSSVACTSMGSPWPGEVDVVVDDFGVVVVVEEVDLLVEVGTRYRPIAMPAAATRKAPTTKPTALIALM